MVVESYALGMVANYTVCGLVKSGLINFTSQWLFYCSCSLLFSTANKCYWTFSEAKKLGSMNTEDVHIELQFLGHWNWQVKVAKI